MLVKPPSGHPLDSPAKRAAPSTRHALRQGRYKSLIVEEGGYLGALLHYTHLNPMRASMTDVKGLRDYRWSSYWYLNHPAKRPVFMDCSGALLAAGGLADTSYGRGKYADCLNWLTSDRAAQDEMAFDKMCRGWALGTKDFKKALIAEAADASGGEDKPTKKVPRYDGATLQEANELRWELVFEQCMEAINKTPDDSKNEIKSVNWKILIAAVLKCKTSATNVWIADQLNMGVPHAVSRYVGIFRQKKKNQEPDYLKLIANMTT